MGNCFSATTVPSSPSLPVVAGRVTLAPAISQPEAEDALASSPQPRSRTISMPRPIVHGRVSSQSSNPRSRVVSAPARPRFKSSVPHIDITRPQPVAAPITNRFDCRTYGPEHQNVVVSAPSVSYPTRNSTPSTPGPSNPSTNQTRILSESILASIEAGRNGDWCKLWSNVHFINKSLKEYVDVIHTGIVEIWIVNDTNTYLSSDRFKINMSHVIRDLDAPTRALRGPGRFISGDEVAKWVYRVYEPREYEIVRCLLMGYIVNLHVILDDIDRAGFRDVTDNDALDVMNEHVRSGRRDRIHRDIRNFVAETYPTRFAKSQKEKVLKKIIDLIREHCDRSSGYI